MSEREREEEREREKRTFCHADQAELQPHCLIPAVLLMSESLLGRVRDENSLPMPGHQDYCNLSFLSRVPICLLEAIGRQSGHRTQSFSLSSSLSLSLSLSLSFSLTHSLTRSPRSLTTSRTRPGFWFCLTEN